MLFPTQGCIHLGLHSLQSAVPVPEMTQWALMERRKFYHLADVGPVSRAQSNNPTAVFAVSKPTAIPVAEKCDIVTDRAKCYGCANKHCVAALGFLSYYMYC